MMISSEFFGQATGVRGSTPSPGRYAGASLVGGNHHRDGERGCGWETGGAKVVAQVKGRRSVATDGSDHLYGAARSGRANGFSDSRARPIRPSSDGEAKRLIRRSTDSKKSAATLARTIETTHAAGDRTRGRSSEVPEPRADSASSRRRRRTALDRRRDYTYEDKR